MHTFTSKQSEIISSVQRKKRIDCSVRAVIQSLESRVLLSSVVVNSVSDTATGSGVVTLTDAIADANSATSPTTITFDPTVFSQPQIITLPTGGLLTLSNTTEPTTITGPSNGVTISGGNVTQVFFVDASATLSMSGLTVTDGNSVAANHGDGGGIYVATGGTLNLSDMTISNCTGMTGCSGGGLANLGTSSLNDVTVTDNSDSHDSAGSYDPNGQGGGDL